MRGISFTPDGAQLISGGEDGTIRIWDTHTGECLYLIHGYAALVQEIAWSPDGAHLASVGSEITHAIYSLHDDAAPRFLYGHAGAPEGVKWSPDGRHIASVGTDNLVRIWDAVTGEFLKELACTNDPNALLRSPAWSPDGQLLAIGTDSIGIQIFDFETGTSRPFGKSSAPIANVRWSPNGAMLAARTEDQLIHVWDVASERLLAEMRCGHHAFTWSQDSTKLVTTEASDEGSRILLWNTNNWEPVERGWKQGAINHLALSSDASEIITGDSNGTLEWWTVRTGVCLREIRAHEGKINMVKLSPDGRLVASGGNDDAINVWKVATGEPVKTLRRDRPYERMDITETRGLNEAQKTTLRALGAVEHSSR